MIIVGLICSPFLFCQELDRSNKKYSVNSTKERLAVFTSFEEFRKANIKKTKSKILIFDSAERLDMINGISVVKVKSVSQCLEKSLEIRSQSNPVIKNKNHIKEILEKNNDNATSILHEYNTNLYNISSLPLRENLRTLYMNFLRMSIDRDIFNKKVAAIMPKKGKGHIAFQNILNLTTSELFGRIQKAFKASLGKSNKEIEEIAKQHNVAIFDLRYYLSSNK